MQRTKILSNITTHDHSDHDCRKSDPVPTFIYSLIKRSCPRHSSFHSSGSSALDPAIYEPCIQSTEKYIDLFSPPKQHPARSRIDSADDPVMATSTHVRACYSSDYHLSDCSYFKSEKQRYFSGPSFRWSFSYKKMLDETWPLVAGRISFNILKVADRFIRRFFDTLPPLGTL